MEENQKGYTIAEGYELPSKGLIYENAAGLSHITLRSMTARDEMKRLSPNTRPLSALADIIEGCIVERPAIHVRDMCIGDYEFLLYKLRIVTYGSKYKISIDCPYCGSRIDTEINLDTLKVKDFDINAYNAAKTVKLPKSGKTIELRPMTPALMDEISIKSKDMLKRYKNSGLDFEELSRITSSIVTIDGAVQQGTALENTVLNFPALDLQKLSLAINDFNSMIGIDTSTTVACPECGSDILTFFRYGSEFFRPTNI